MSFRTIAFTIVAVGVFALVFIGGGGADGPSTESLSEVVGGFSNNAPDGR